MAKVLLVEDNEMNRDMLSRRLTKKGYDVVMAVDGREGVDMASIESPDIILLDMSLPVMNGWTAAGHLKSDEATASIPIIALTAHALAGIGIGLSKLGVTITTPNRSISSAFSARWNT